jgi:hypothetical protein
MNTDLLTSFDYQNLKDIIDIVSRLNTASSSIVIEHFDQAMGMTPFVIWSKKSPGILQI